MENYKFIEKIGRGSHGTCYLLKDLKNNCFRVCKSVGEKYKKHAEREIALLTRISHKRIVRLVYDSKVNTSTYLILEFANYGTLENMIKYFISKSVKPSLGLAWSLIAQASDALFYLHSNGIIHRDIKPANILINKFSVREQEYLEFKICDFSLSTYLESVDYGTVVGTPFYMAPEVIQKINYDHTVDVWSLGVTMYELLNLERPFTGENRIELYSNIKTMKIDRICADDQLNEVLIKCFEKKGRITAKNLCKIEKIRLNLTILELKYRENRIEYLEQKIREFEAIKY